MIGKKILSLFKNFYWSVGVGFLIWVTFLDSNDLISRYKMASRIRSLNRQKEYYLEKIKEVEKDRDELLNNPELLEKYAREKYLMKRKNEDIFIITKE
ncbi:MAG: septum formation initiator [Candidatus Nephrothrix sp. EaCA]|nr:MAG: septum formation initiator [Candidatus Nephrothrix sp. EaCA]